MQREKNKGGGLSPLGWQKKQVQEKENKRPPPREEARRPGRELLREAG